MKVAGRKNDGAWFRANKVIKSLNDTDSESLSVKIQAISTISSAHSALLGLIAETGTAGIPHASTPLEWADSFVTDGIPRQVWFGRLSWTTYAGNKDDGYAANYQSQMHHFAKELRSVVTKFIYARRAVRDLFNSGHAKEGNPGGLPDATKNS